MTRALIADAHRVVVKVGSSSLTGPGGRLDGRHLFSLVDTLAGAHEAGRQIILVSSGAIAAGMGPLHLKARPKDLAVKQAAAAVGQRVLLERYATLFGARDINVGQVLLTVDDIQRKSSYANAQRTFNALLRMGALPIVNENDTVATQEIHVGDNDRLAALVAHMVRADALVLLSDVDALYTAHPSDPDARPIGVVEDAAALDVDTSKAGTAVGTGGMTTKIEAARIASDSGIPVVLASADRAHDALWGEETGTLFLPTGKRRSRSLLWLGYASQVEGTLVLDDGAVRALVQRDASLLAAGITAVKGSFQAGDPVALVDSANRPVGRGLVNYDADELPAMLGRSTSDLDADHAREVIHRDHLVVRRRMPRSAASEG